MGIGRATSVLVGQHLGADQPDHAEKTSWISAGVGNLVLKKAAGNQR